MPALKQLVSLALVGMIALTAAAQSTDGIEVDIDGAVAAVGDDAEARARLEEECIAVLGADAEWHEVYRAVRILAVIGTEKSIPPLAVLLEREDTTHLARLALETMPFAEVDTVLVEALADAPRKVALGIIASLAARKNAGAEALIALMTTTEDTLVMEHAAIALAHIGGEEAERQILEMLSCGEPRVELAGAEALLTLAGEMTSEGRGEEAASLYQRLLEERWPDHIRTGAFVGLLSALPAHAQEAVMHVIAGDDLILRATGIAALATLPGVGVTARFSDALSSMPTDIQVGLLESLMRREEAMDLAFLYGLLEDDREEMRIAAMKAVADHGDASSIEPVAKTLARSDSRQEKQAGVETLRRLRGDDVDAALVRFMESAPEAQRADIIEALVQRRAPGAVDALLAQAAQDGVRAAAFRGLGQLADEEHFDALLSLLVGMEGDPGREEAEAAVTAVARNLGQSTAELVVTKAVYGDLPDGLYADVTRRVQRSVADGALSMAVSNDTLVADPAPGVVKRLRVEYTLDGVPNERIVGEGGALNISAQTISGDVVARIVSAMDNAPGSQGRASLLRVLSRLGGPQAYDVVLAAVQGQDAEIRDAAIRALAAWPDANAAPPLAELFAGVESGPHRGVALRGCVRLLRLGVLDTEVATGLYRDLLAASNSPEERRLLLSGLAELNSPDAVALVYPLLEEEGVKEEAALAFDRIRTQLGDEAFNAAMETLAPAAVEDETFIAIFNGVDLQGWSGDPALWRVEDGHLVGETREDAPLKHNTFIVWDAGEVEDFDLKFRYKSETEWVNSGVQIRSEQFDMWRVRGYQPDIASEDWITGICYEEGGRGILARRGQKVVFGEDGTAEVTTFGDETALGDYIYKDDWNEYHVRARGNQFYTRINGHKMHEVIDNAPEARRRGIIAFQLHTGQPMKIRFSDIMLRRVAPEAN